MNYWLIKARPDSNDFRRFPIAGKTDVWYTAHLPRTWNRGDLLFVWAGAPMLRTIGLADLTKPNAGFRSGYEHFRVRYRTSLIQGPTLADLRSDKIVGSASFLKSGPAGTVFPLTATQGRHLLARLQKVGLPVADERSPEAQPTRKEDAILVRRFGQGFGSAAENRRVERAAIGAASRYFRERGWLVSSRERAKLGYDLECRRSPERLHVEVKGVRGVALSFILTAGEYQRALSDPVFRVALWLTHLENRPFASTPGLNSGGISAWHHLRTRLCRPTELDPRRTALIVVDMQEPM